MKTIASSEAPQGQSYVHLAYLSASASKILQDPFIDTAILMMIVSMFGIFISSGFKRKNPKAWRRAVLALTAIPLLVLILALLSYPRLTRG